MQVCGAHGLHALGEQGLLSAPGKPRPQGACCHLSFQAPQADAMTLFMWQVDIIGVARFIGACLGRVYPSAGPPVGGQTSDQPRVGWRRCNDDSSYCSLALGLAMSVAVLLLQRISEHMSRIESSLPSLGADSEHGWLTLSNYCPAYGLICATETSILGRTTP